MKGTELERHLEKWLVSQGWECYRPPRTKYGRQDMFGAFDILALRAEMIAHKRSWWVWAIQVTTECQRSGHRKRLERPWPTGWDVSLVTRIKRQDPADGRRYDYFWKIQRWNGHSWEEPYAVRYDPRGL